MNRDSYANRGVSSSKEEVQQAIRHLEKGEFNDTFCKILPDVSGSEPTYCNILHTDTAGTKPSLAYIYWKETGDMTVWKDIVQDALVMNTDDMLCSGVIDNILISSNIARNKHLIPGEVIDALIKGTKDLMDQFQDFGYHIHHGGGETADVGDIVRTLDVGFTAFARLKREDVIRIKVQPGDAIVGLSSYGQALYETQYNSGMGSNGLTSARHDLLHHSLFHKYPESYSSQTAEELLYSGPYLPTDIEPETGLSFGKLILSPTRTFIPVVKKVIETIRPHLHGIIHNTGGGLYKSGKFMPGIKAIKNSLLPVPPLFRLISQVSGTSYQEMAKVFNMGCRMEIYLPEKYASTVMDIASSYQISSAVIGYCEPGEGIDIRF